MFHNSQFSTLFFSSYLYNSSFLFAVKYVPTKFYTNIYSRKWFWQQLYCQNIKSTLDMNVSIRLFIVLLIWYSVNKLMRTLISFIYFIQFFHLWFNDFIQRQRRLLILINRSYFILDCDYFFLNLITLFIEFCYCCCCFSFLWIIRRLFNIEYVHEWDRLYLIPVNTSRFCHFCSWRSFCALLWKCLKCLCYSLSSCEYLVKTECYFFVCRSILYRIFIFPIYI